MADTEKSGTKVAVVKLSQVMEQLGKEGVQFFLNSLLEPVVRLPDDPYQKDWPADSQRVQDRLNTVYYDLSEDGYLKTAERDFLVSLIREECRKGGRRFTEVEGPQTEKEAIVQGILCLVNEVEEFDDLTAVLLNKLRTFQTEGRIQRSEEIPVFTNIFSRRLGRLIPTLQGYGVEVQVRHEDDGSHCKLKRLPHYQKEPDATKLQSSGESSGTNPGRGNDMEPDDESDGVLRDDEEDAAALAGALLQTGIGSDLPASGDNDRSSQSSNRTKTGAAKNKNGGEK